MEVSLESLISYEKLKTDLDDVFKVVEKNGKAVILKDNEPMYIILKYDRTTGAIEKILGPSTPKRTLQEAMKIILKEVDGRKMGLRRSIIRSAQDVDITLKCLKLYLEILFS